VQAHDTDVTSLVFGLVFAGSALVWVLVQTGVLTVAVLPLAVPVLLVIVGVVGVAAALTRGQEATDQATDRAEAF
jgi:apolipoprotein N-acyltransferase